MDTEPKEVRIVKGMIKFLKGELASGRLDADRAESVEVAIQCLESAYDIDGDNPIALHNAVDLATQITGFEAPEPPSNATEEEKLRAEQLKVMGNDLMKNNCFQEAIQRYTSAICLDSGNAVYYCNRAAAFSRIDDNRNAINDCRQAIRLDPNYPKAYGRLGIAYSNLNLHEEARKAYQKAVDLEPGNATYLQNLELANEKIRESRGEQPRGQQDMPVDLGAFINNPGLINMASQMLADPNLRNVMSGIMSMGQGNPNIEALLQAGQNLAQHMQNANPEFVENLRRQMAGTSSSGGGDVSMPDEEDDQPPLPPTRAPRDSGEGHQ